MKTVIPIDIVKLGEENSFHLFITAFVNGQPCELLIDTGASHTIFDANLIPELPDNEIPKHEIQSAGINEGELNCKLGRIEKFELGKLKQENLTVVILDLTHVNNMYKKCIDKHIAGLIGSEFLLAQDAIIDYKKRELVLKKIKMNRKKKK